ncbi:hypothetical protein PVAP13_1KG446100 [Panicum virgatum]|uniref:Uncharacterized protein n=1 Tax=Panicum virgatum TaxID=38727 RepID=A0A8T0XTS3_PANVG|nr:hypothetical protein PVAP13_1KG446100 [Panicum virgatum]KAG2660510.1 hypothetical protein PVAP13_1KG446100 [Panicum virgatum]KAG2660513.1 hypothetical protein PVAP13_1KG446100 [Panicum virgatum]KAG2660516.1 hypothetical protein PVAP13_1KG446100 [Panicum virgatum]
MAAGQEGAEEGAPNRTATELEEGAATAVAGRRGRQIRLPPPRTELEPAESGQPRRLPAAQPSARAATMEEHWRREQERAECRPPQLRRYARARARTRGGSALPEDHGEEAEEARAEGEEARAEGKAEPEEARAEREARAEEARAEGEEVEETRDGEGRGERRRRRRRAPWNSSIASFLAAPLISPASRWIGFEG